jgi:hypothetical protein
MRGEVFAPLNKVGVSPHRGKGGRGHVCHAWVFGWQAMVECPDGPANTKDPLDSRFVVHHLPKRDLLGRGSFVSACPDDSAYTRSCVRPMAGYPHRGGGGEGTEYGGR